MNLVPNVPEFLRTAMALRLTSEDFEELIDQLKRRGPSNRGTASVQP
jgi:hypothetical protein